jgi:dCMP deaminase
MDGIMITEKEQQYVELTQHIANIFSRDNSTKVGCLVLHPETLEILVTGYNGFPRKVIELPNRKERPLKYTFTEHAERNAIYSAARRGIPLEGATIITTLFPCADCARAIIQSGIKRLISKPQDNERWTESSGYATAMLEEANINISLLT